MFVSEPVTIPRLCLSGKAPPRGTTVEMDHIEVVPHMDRWPSFHNGVAAGLRIPGIHKDVDSNWITFNKVRFSKIIFFKLKILIYISAKRYSESSSKRFG